MPIFGNQAARTGQIDIATDTLMGHFDTAFTVAQGNPVLGGNLVSCHVNMSGTPSGQPDATIQMAVYDTLFMAAPTTWTVLAISNTLCIPNGNAYRWYSLPIVGVLTPGNSYATALLSVHTGGSPAVQNSAIAGGSYKSFIVPGVFPDPLGVKVNSHYNLLYTTYVLDDDDGCPTAACCCMHHGNSNMN